MGDIIKGIVTLSWDDIKAGFGKITSNFGATIKEAYGDLKNFGSAVGQNIVDGINNTISGAKIAHITIPKPETTPKMANAPADTWEEVVRLQRLRIYKRKRTEEALLEVLVVKVPMEVATVL